MRPSQALTLHAARCLTPLSWVRVRLLLVHREMGHINQLPGLLVYTPPATPPPSAAAGIFSSASQFMDPSLRAAAGAAANAAANSAVGAAAAAAVAAAGAAASAWPMQVAANYMCLLETARVLLAAPLAGSEEQRAQVSVIGVCLHPHRGSHRQQLPGTLVCRHAGWLEGGVRS